MYFFHKNENFRIGDISIEDLIDDGQVYCYSVLKEKGLLIESFTGI